MDCSSIIQPNKECITVLLLWLAPNTPSTVTPNTTSSADSNHLNPTQSQPIAECIASSPNGYPSSSESGFLWVTDCFCKELINSSWDQALLLGIWARTAGAGGRGPRVALCRKKKKKLAQAGSAAMSGRIWS